MEDSDYFDPTTVDVLDEFIYECKVCGALVTKLVAHVDWHRGLSNAIQAAMED